MSERINAVVIGAGLGGLAAGVVLAGEGLSVTVLEAQSSPGGYAASFQRGPYRFDTALHALGGLAPGGGYDEIYRALDIQDRLRLHRLDPLYRVQWPDSLLDAHADPFRYERELVALFPEQRVGIRAYLDEALAAYRDGRRFEVDQAAGDELSLQEIMTRYPAFVRISGETWEQMMARHVTDPRARSALGALWGYGGLPPSRMAALFGALGSASYSEHGGWYPAGGARALSDALVEVLRERGGDIRYDRPATAIECDGDRATAVVTGDGQRLEADIVVSNASAPATVMDLVGRDRLPAEYVARVEAPSPSYTTFGVYLGLDRDLFGEQGLPHELMLSPSYDIDAMWDAGRRGDWERTELLVTDYTRVDAGCAPSGHAVVVLTTVAGWDYEDTWGTGGDLTNYGQNPRYLELKDRAADALVAGAAAVLPGLVEAIRVREASSPLTNFRYTGNPHGAIEGYENSPENSGLGWLPNGTPIRNLFLAGAWTNTGGMNPAMHSGVTAARLALRRTPVIAGT
jgi:prolycopene isomerase